MNENLNEDHPGDDERDRTRGKDRQLRTLSLIAASTCRIGCEPREIAYLFSLAATGKLFQMDKKSKGETEYGRDLEELAELLLDIYLDKINPQREDVDGSLTRPAGGRKIRLPLGAEPRQAKKSSTNSPSIQ